jgi:type IV pilus assembly protein PilM
MGNRTVSVYIDDSYIRVMSTSGKRVIRFAELTMETPLSLIDTGEKEAELAGKIRQLLKFNKISPRKVMLCLSGHRCLTRPVILPELPKAMLGEAVIREAKRVLPMPLEQLYLSWQTLSVSGGKTNLFLVALPRQIADKAIRVMNKAGYKPYLVDIKPLSLARLSSEATSIILDVQPKEFDIVFIINGIPQPIRTIAFPQEALSLQDKFNIVKEDIKRTLEFVRSNAEENPLKVNTPIFISGEITDHPELYEPLGKELGFKIDKLTSPFKYLKYLEPSLYLANVGMASKEYTRLSGPLLPNVNALPDPYRPMHISLNKLMAVPAALFAVGIIALLMMTVKNAATNINTVQNQLDNNNYLLEKRQAQNKLMMDDISTLQQQITNAEAEYDLYDAAYSQLVNTGNIFNRDLTTSIENIKNDLCVNSLTLDQNVVNIIGDADNEEHVFSYVRRLMDSGRFKEITINSIVLKEETESSENPSVGADDFVSYQLTCILKGDR